MKEPEMRVIANFIHQALAHPDDEARLQRLRSEVMDFCQGYPLYSPEWEA